MSSAQRRAREKENLKRAILDAARELFVTEDYHAVSMRRIADKIEYSPTAIYLYFKDKDEIFLNLVEEGFAMLCDRLYALDIADPIERLGQGGRAYVDFAFTQPHYYRIMFEIGDKKPPEELAGCVTNGVRAFEFIRQCVTEAKEQGKLAGDQDVNVFSHAIWACMHGAVMLALSGRLFMLPEDQYPALFEAIEKILLNGFFLLE